MRRCCIVTAAVVLLAAGSVFARDVVVTSIVQDSGMYSVAAGGNSNRGDGGRFDLGPGTGNEGFLIQFDLSSIVLAPGEVVSAASMEMFFARGTGIGAQVNSLDIVAGDLKQAWQEGVGNAGATGDLGYPWGPASVGDAVFNYQNVTSVAPDAAFGGLNVATGGVAWGAPGGRSVGTDVNVLIIDDNIVYAPTSIGTDGSLGSVDFTPAGVAVLNAWVTGAQNNYGMSVWTKDTSTGYTFPLASSEHATARGPILTVTVTPEPATLGLLGLGSVGLAALRRRRK